jgi:HAMP domain-containing protein
MDRKHYAITFLGGMALGMLVALIALFLNAYLNRPQSTTEEAWQYLLEKEIENEVETQIILNELLRGQEDPFLDIASRDRDLCSVLPRDEINRLLPGVNLASMEQGQIPPFSDCDYFKDGSNVPVISFRHNFANFQIIKDLQKAQGLDAKTADLAGIGDAAFFSEIAAIPGTDQSFLAIFFRVGMNGYSVGSFELIEDQLRVVAGAIAGKLIQ